ncbi:MAG: LysR family transcriptional regulator [Candidatus Spyradocola sp.]
MDYEVPEYFIAIAQEGSISRAAQRLYLAQPSLSQYLRKLEQKLGVELIRREARGIALTQAGRVYYEYALQAVRRKAEMQAQVAALKQDVSGQMDVDASVLSIPMGRLYCDFLKLHPLVQARFVHLEAQARSNPPDIVITTRQLPAAEWSGEPLLTEPLLVAVSAGHPFARRRSIRIQELAKEQFLFTQNREIDQLLVKFCAEAGFEPRVLMEYYSMYPVTALVEEGVGITILPAHRLRSVSPERMALIPITDVTFERTILLYRPVNGLQNPAADSFAAYIRENIDRVTRVSPHASA